MTTAQSREAIASAPVLPLAGGVAVRVFACFAFAYLLSYAFRAVNAVIAPELVADFSLPNARLGLLSSAYFITFAAMQLPLGVLLDRFGPRRTEAALLWFAVLGAAVFALSTSFAGLWLGRALIGAGVSACLMAAFTAFRAWFPAARQGQLASWMLVAGTAGALATTVPVQQALPAIGWRGVFATMAALIALAALFIWRGLPRFGERAGDSNRSADVHAGVLGEAEAQPTPAPGYREIFVHPYFIRMLPLGVVNHGGFIALQTLWLGPWMTTVLGASREATAGILFGFNLALLTGYLFNGWFTPKLGKFGIPLMRYVMALMALGMLVQGAAIWFGSAAPWWLWLAVALASTVQILGQSTVGLAFPQASAGRANTAYNLQIFVGAFALQWGIGMAADHFIGRGASHADALRITFALFLLLQVLCWAWYYIAPRFQAVAARRLPAAR